MRTAMVFMAVVGLARMILMVAVVVGFLSVAGAVGSTVVRVACAGLVVAAVAVLGLGRLLRRRLVP